MKNSKKIFIFLFFLSFFMYLSCPFYIDSQNYELCIYKTKNDYSENVPVELSKDNTRITSFSGPRGFSDRYPLKLTNNYLLGGTFGINTGFLSITKTEYKENYDVAPGPDSLYALLIDKDPFKEFYYHNRGYDVFCNEDIDGLDTARINDIIMNGELELYFERLK
ncbi:MAG: hypothetical protein U9N51_12105 [Bacteroidota bacterium]|nr:hypothetical protein [Bacteroidota bacterium]